MTLANLLRKHFQVVPYVWLVVGGIALAVGVTQALDLPISLAKDFPFFSVIRPTGPNWTIVIVCAVVFLTCATVAFVPLPSRTSPVGPSAPPTLAPAAAKPERITFLTVLEADQSAVRRLIRSQSDAVPEIVWPQASDELVTAVDGALKSLDAKGSSTGAEAFRKAADALGVVELIRQQVPPVLPDLVRRMKPRFSSDDIVVAVSRFLVLANYQIHAPLAYYATWDSFASHGPAIPQIWRELRGSSARDMRILTRTPSDAAIFLAQIGSIGDTHIYQGSGLGPYLFAPRDPTKGGLIFPSDIVEWFIPQMEWLHLRGGVNLPACYETTWRFVKLSGE